MNYQLERKKSLIGLKTFKKNSCGVLVKWGFVVIENTVFIIYKYMKYLKNYLLLLLALSLWNIWRYSKLEFDIYSLN